MILYLPLIIFLLSLIGIISMIAWKLPVARNGNTFKVHSTHHIDLNFEKARSIIRRRAKRISYIGVFLTLRIFIKTTHFLKVKSMLIWKKLVSKLGKKKEVDAPENKEASGYLKTISEYRKKIKEIKHIIKEEEGIK